MNSTDKLLNSLYNHKHLKTRLFPLEFALAWVTQSVYQSRLDPALKVRILLPFIIAVFPENLSLDRVRLPLPALSLNPAAYFHAAHHFEYWAGSLPGLGDSGRRGIRDE